MNFLPLVVALLCLVATTSAQASNRHGADLDDNDFAEFEEFDEEEPSAGDAGVKDADGDDNAAFEEAAPVHDTEAADDDEAMVEDEDEFEYLNDEEEFEGFDKDSKPINKGGKPEKTPDLKITNIPGHLRTNWDSFYLEMLMLAGLGVYFLNFLAGKTKNHKIAQAWLAAHKGLLEEHFTIVGDDGSTKEVQQGVLMKESEHLYSLWCSGRTLCDGMLIEMKLLKRQDLIQTISRIFKPALDQIVIKVVMDENAMAPFVMALGLKKTIAKVHRELNDLSIFCKDQKQGKNYGLPEKYRVLSEINDTTMSVIDQKVQCAIQKFDGIVDYMHFSDQFSGPKVSTEDGEATKMPDTKKVLIFSFNLTDKIVNNPEEMKGLQELLKMVFHCVDKMKRVSLTQDGKMKSMKNRKAVEEQFSKMTHLQRAEAAQLRREEKRREDKERMMNEDDPEKQRKWEERTERRDKKKSQSKMKMMKVKAM
ncbi:unnamed protein product [Owenia fusiformis]|uniref:PAT complex subunit CCDC47 n=1 Tax=Owenia fusiformis TaxID=6347 RepID=A0A8J1UUF9_OWEFU|nr:unnamed protein product [Owenia fusiformis]